MIRKTSVLVILALISSVSACSFKIGAGDNRAISNSTGAETKADENLTADAAAGGETESAVKQKGGKTGTYKYKSGGARNQISVQELEGNKLRVELYASYEYKAASGLFNANVGEARGIAPLTGDTAILLPEEIEGCEISLKFSGNKLIVKPKNEFESCGFGMYVSAEGTYTKTSGKPDFNDSHEATTNNDSPANQGLKTERIRFASGKSSATVEGKVGDGEEKVYLIGAKAGQTMTIEVPEGGANNDVFFHLVAPDGSLPMGRAGDKPQNDAVYSGALRQSGDYKIVIYALKSKNADFKMLVSIE
ncbi:MAG TPA: hypothetical protein VGB02_16125 [Pyrinomonadaceae bacterium]|jgi:hypothetical protein